MKTQPFALLAGIAFVLATALPAAAPALADTGPCQPVAAKQLQALGIATTDVKEMSMIEVLDNPEFGTTSEWQAWTKLQSCPGNIVVKMTPRCRVKDSYTRGDCKIANVSNY